MMIMIVCLYGLKKSSVKVAFSVIVSGVRVMK